MFFRKRFTYIKVLLNNESVRHFMVVQLTLYQGYRQKFRKYLKYDSKTHVEFSREKKNLFNRWCYSKELGQDFEKLKQMSLLEEFKDKAGPDIKIKGS